ncbi:hypothetical protein G5V57_04500 [Nordella sp. HKS 07]|uniref:hypothetical protein n=1 Tax=Nordella sp. HKS 07 TaxID=2712222 RepID=UPI0013E18019|nr:hypothetical protein [Nordella sp. HKS 07]QIG47069.1 hypothetical protein G5V57_04500 [Nordella sp. HKS 07]
MSMSSRPLLKKGIAELEKLFDQNRDDPQFLKTLLAELSERKVPRARELHRRALQAVSVSRETPKAKAEIEAARESRARVAASSRAAAAIPPEQSAHAAEPIKEPQIRGPVRIAPEPPPVTNKATDILGAWTAMEVLSPPSFRKPEDLASGDRFRIAPLDKGKLPWEGDGEKSRPNQKLYYQIVLGSIDMEAAVSSLLQIYSDSRIERPSARGEAVLATIMVDRTGRPVESEAVSISSFGWGVPVALAGRLRDLGNWSQVERQLVEQLEEKIVSEDKDGNPLPLTAKAIDAAYRWLVETLGLDARFAEQPVFAVRSYQYFKLQDPPESILLNSFFLEDLARAAELTGTERVRRTSTAILARQNRRRGGT